MFVKSNSESIQNVKMFNIFSLESLDASCKDYLISSVGMLSYDRPKTNLLTRVQAEINEVVVLYVPVLLLILPCFHYLLVGAACIFFVTTFSTLGNLLAEVVKMHANY